MTDQAITTICSAVGIALALFINKWFELLARRQEREQTRLDEKAKEERHMKAIADVAKVALESKQEILTAGATRRNEIINEVKQVKTVAVKSALKSQEAIVAANNVTEKTNTAVEIATEALKRANNEPQEVHITNDVLKVEDVTPNENPNSH